MSSQGIATVLRSKRKGASGARQDRPVRSGEGCHPFGERTLKAEDHQGLHRRARPRTAERAKRLGGWQAAERQPTMNRWPPRDGDTHLLPGTPGVGAHPPGGGPVLRGYSWRATCKESLCTWDPRGACMGGWGCAPVASAGRHAHDAGAPPPRNARTRGTKGQVRGHGVVTTTHART
jgi:hypothetical protein